MLHNFISIADRALIGAKSKIAILDATLDVEKMLNADGAAEGLKGVDSLISNYASIGFKFTQKIGVYAMLIVLVFVGIRLVVHGGNTRKRRKIKDGVPSRLIGALLILGAIGVITLFRNLFLLNEG